MYLRHFAADELLFDSQECFLILRFFFVNPGIQAASLTVEDRSFAQALLVEAIDASYKMGYVEIIFSTFYGKTPASTGDVLKLVKKFVQKSVKHWFKHANETQLSKPEIYESVRATLANRARSAWLIRLQTDEMTY